MAAEYRGSAKDGVLEVFYVSVGGHVVIAVALVWFIYQLLRAAERMILPRHLSSDPEVARTLLGINTPQREMARMLKQIFSMVARSKVGEGE